ncbi:Aste57867_16479 [Aphanomyces stellatus]|uniref:Aste57867_16479 protein n=1 Tax=Aphanomyces stellatus TaxID=120398 RepID=A0A485L5W5_9STRA|nr:hypothetical protein As57867_016422 [Aphanomyces stellatus]VFT93253.1 Aste57867_16479 [Aphanomyces stellatus]
MGRWPTSGASGQQPPAWPSTSAAVSGGATSRPWGNWGGGTGSTGGWQTGGGSNAFVGNFIYLQYVYLATYAIMTTMSLTIIVYLRRKRSTAFQGDLDAAHKIILPTFEALFWVVSAMSGAFTLYFIVQQAAGLKPATNFRWYAELLPQGRQFVAFVIVFLLLHNSLSRRSLVHASCYSLLVSAAPVVLVQLCETTTLSEAAKFAVHNTFRAFYVAFYVWLYVKPISRATVRAQREYYLFSLLFYVGIYVSKSFFYVHNFSAAIVALFITAAHDTVTPIFIWRLLRADTDYWRGLSDRAIELHHKFHESHAMEEIVSAQGLHVLLEVHRKDIIDFAHLDLTRPLVVGASANVYLGRLHGATEVAVKVYSPSEISEATIVDFSDEAALCATLKHPNVVYFYGMCICPPRICLVYELCRGNLQDAMIKHASRNYTEPFWPKLCHMLDATRAVAYLHSFSPPFVHRDIKPSNFLLDAANVVKLTDFGESRSMAAELIEIDVGERKMTVRGSVEYMAPEVIDGKQGQAVYTETADIYSLGVTLWDILHPGREKYPQTKRNHLNTFKMVLDGQRPPIDAEVPQMLHDLLENMWNADPHFRPSAKTVVAVLEDLHEDMCGQVAFRLASSMTYMVVNKDMKIIQAPPSGLQSRSFSGDEIVQSLLAHHYAFEVEEAIRLGNALMDAGCLHHNKHNLPFTNTSTSLYTIDLDELEARQNNPDQVNRPKALEANEVLDDVTVYSSGTSFLASTMVGSASNGLCDCRKLGQGHVKPKVARKKLFHQRCKGEQHMLTVNLLNQSGNGDFGEFTTSGLSTPSTLALSTI